MVLAVNKKMHKMQKINLTTIKTFGTMNHKVCKKNHKGGLMMKTEKVKSVWFIKKGNYYLKKINWTGKTFQKIWTDLYNPIYFMYETDAKNVVDTESGEYVKEGFYSENK